MKSFNEFHFKGQKQGETILLVVHRHWLDILSQFFVVMVLFLVFLGLFFYAPHFFPRLDEVYGRELFFFFQSLFLIFLWFFSFLVWVDYYFDVWIVTNERIVNIEQRGMFSRSISELKLENIQDVTVEVLGAIPTFFNYGNLFVQTAAERERFLFRHVPNPYGIKDQIMNLQKKWERRERREIGDLINRQIHNNLP